MTTHRPTYALVTPARNEAENLRRLARCLAAQTAPPERWIVVDDGSTDETAAVARAFAAEHGWATLIASPGAAARGGALPSGRRTGRDVLAFNAGVAALGELPAVVVKLDADVSFAADYFERLLARFAADPRLGIAGGLCHELEDGEWRPRHSTESHVRGATRAYRRECFLAVSPLEERLGWDGVDELKANVRGWKTVTFKDLPFFHHRPVGVRDGLRRAFADQGATAHFMGYRPSYVVLRALHHARREPAAVAMAWGYALAALRRWPQCEDREAREYLRRRQRARTLPLRVLEAAGRRAG